MKKYNQQLIWLWIIGLLILAAFAGTLLELPRILQEDNKFKLFIRIIILFLMIAYLANKISDYRKRQKS